MLLRIDVYPYNASIEKTDADGIPISPLPPLYANMATTRADGELFTVGRKETDVVLTDKSVSRKHLTAFLITTHDSIEDRQAKKATSPEEEEACEVNDGFGLVVTDSSRFGTFLVKEGSTPRSKTPAKDADATDNSDTEDESQKPNSAAAVESKLFPVAAKLTNSKATLEKFEGRLLLSDFKDRVLIQCGQNGSTLLIRRIPLTLVSSSLDKSTKDLWTKRLPALGASLLPNVDEHMTHLVSNKRVSSGKHLAAWYMNKPLVTTEYLQAIWDRLSPSACMPKESDCEPVCDGKDAFWKKKPKTNLLSGCTYLCLLNDDMKALVQAAGATVVPLYDESEKDAINRIKDMDLTHTFYISTAVAKVKKIVQYLKKHDVAHVTQKALGQAVAKFLRLEDHHGNPIGPEVTEEVPQEEEQPSLPPIPEASKETSEQSMEQLGVEKSAEEPSQKKHANEESQEPVEEEATTTKAASSRKKRSKESSGEPEDEEPPKQRRKTSKETEEEEDTTPTETTSSRKKRSKESSQEAEEEEPPKQRRKTSDAAAEEDTSTKTSSRKKRSKESSQEVEEEEPPKQRRKKSKDLEPVEEEEEMPLEDDDDDDDESGWNAGDEPKKLEVSTDGWFVAAPSGKKRKAYIREIDIEGSEKPPPTAATAKSSKLVVGPRKATSTNYRATSMGRRGGKDFKKFHKNTITKGSMSRIQLRSVLPKESEAEQKLNERERALEEEQRAAEALFRDPNAGIRGHFKPKARRKRS